MPTPNHQHDFCFKWYDNFGLSFQNYAANGSGCNFKPDIDEPLRQLNGARFFLYSLFYRTGSTEVGFS